MNSRITKVIYRKEGRLLREGRNKGIAIKFTRKDIKRVY